MKQFILLFLFFMGLAFTDPPNGLIFPKNWPKPTYSLSDNPIHSEAINLGRKLFYDPILSADSTISCASCHSPYNSFAHTDHALSHGIHDSVGRRNAMALVNLAWQTSFMHDGAIHHLDMVPLAPISHPSEMGTDIQEVVNRLNQNVSYPTLFTNAFGIRTVTGEYTLKALSQFLLTLISSNAKYDRVMRKEETFNPQEENGYRIFKIHCASCHAEPLFTNGRFYNTGLPEDSVHQDKGRMAVTGKSEDSLAFKVPTLRNIFYTYPYMHDGRFKTLASVIKHYTNDIQPSPYLAEDLKKPISLTADEKVDLIAFLKTLSDMQFLFNPANQYPK